ncbi:MAG: hypothetical protein L0Z53_11575 [Acidobacteriales bacterium]|nr:hypothetical protein [Terriglobales bacterium]
MKLVILGVRDEALRSVGEAAIHRRRGEQAFVDDPERRLAGIGDGNVVSIAKHILCDFAQLVPQR